MMEGIFKHKYIVAIILVVASASFYSYFAYQLERTEHLKLLGFYAILFLLFLKLVNYRKIDFKFLFGAAIILRLIFLFAIPNLSQDFYRFIWDGRMLLEGFNPYLYTPQSFIDIQSLPVNQAQELYEGMGELNAGHFTNYPPVNQLCFYTASLFANNSILGSAIVLRIIIIAADIGIILMGKKLLERLGLSVNNIFWFALNPLIIIELTGNLHFEGVMLFFLIWSLYLLHKGLYIWAAIIFALSISTKLIPLMFLPLFFWWFVSKKGQFGSTKKLIFFYTIVGVASLILFAPYFSKEFIANYASTVGLWFQNFEFNASLYYLAREVGYLFRGYNEIAIIGRYTAILVMVIIFMLSIFRRHIVFLTLIRSMLIAFTIYLLTTTTVHPWYLSTLLLLSVFTPYKFALAWSATIILSYLAYRTTGFKEEWWILALEYLPVYAILIWELAKKDKLQPNHLDRPLNQN